MQDEIDASQSQGPINNPKDVYQQNEQFNDCTFIFTTPSSGIPEPTSPPPPPPLHASPTASIQSGISPFIIGPSVPPEHFYGREKQRTAIRNQIGGRTPGSVSIVGLRRIGKSSLLLYLKERTGEFCPDLQTIVVPLSFSDNRFHTPEGVNEGLRRGIEKNTGNSPWNKNECDDLWAIADGLAKVRNSGYRLIVLIDEFEGIANRLEAFKEWGDDWSEKAATHGYFSLVISSRRPIQEIYQQVGQTSKFYTIFIIVQQGAFEQHEWHKLVKDGFAHNRGAVSELTQTHLDFIDELAGGLPLFVQIAASCLWEHGDNDHDSRDSVRTAFANIAMPHFNDLWKGLYQNEKVALRALVTGCGTPDSATIRSLQQYGVVRRVGEKHEVFSSMFNAFVREQGK